MCLFTVEPNVWVACTQRCLNELLDCLVRLGDEIGSCGLHGEQMFGKTKWEVKKKKKKLKGAYTCFWKQCHAPAGWPPESSGRPAWLRPQAGCGWLGDQECRT